jgi:hypothetical protein
MRTSRAIAWRKPLGFPSIRCGVGAAAIQWGPQPVPSTHAARVDRNPVTTAGMVRCSNVRRLLDHENGRKANCLGGLDVNNKIKLGRELDREFPRIGALNALVDVISFSAVLIWEIDAV